MLDGRKVHRRALSSQHTVPLALVFMIAHQAAYRGQRIVFKEHPSRLVKLFVEHQADDMRDRRVNGASLLALGNLAVKAALRFFQDVNGHMHLPFFGSSEKSGIHDFSL